MKYHFYTRNFFFYIAAAFLNAFVDLGHKITIQNILFQTLSGTPLLVSTQLINALMLLPFVLLFIPAGSFNDTHDKRTTMRILALIAVVLCACLTIFYLLGLFWIAFSMTLLLAVQATFYSPAKFGYIRDIVSREELGKANAVLQSISIVSMLLSTLLFSALFSFLSHTVALTKEQYIIHMYPIGIILTILSLCEYICLSRIKNEKSRVRQQMPRYPFRRLLRNKHIVHPMILLALFFGMSQTIMATFPAFAKEHLHIINAFSVQLNLGLSALGVIIGSVIIANIANQRQQTGFVALGMILYAGATVAIIYGITYGAFIILGIAAGFIIVPLNTAIQRETSRVLQGSAISLANLFQNTIMLICLALGMEAALYGISARILLGICAVIALCGSLYSIHLYKRHLFEAILSILIHFRYHICCIGNPHALPRRCLLVGNHVSYIDWAFLQITLNRKIYFLMEKELFDIWFLKPILEKSGVIPIQSRSFRHSFRIASDLLRAGNIVVIFPEGELTKNGEIGIFKNGYTLLTKKSDAEIVPFFIGGMFRSRFSKKSQNASLFHRRDITLCFGTTLDDTSPDGVKKAVCELQAISDREFDR